MKRTCLCAVAFAVVNVFLLASCGQEQHGTSNAHPAAAPAALNGLTARQLVASMSQEGLPARNPYDATSVMCKEVHCVEAVDTDTVAVLKFPATGPAQKYAGSISNSYQVEDVVLVFMPAVTSDMRRDYENAVAAALA